MFSVNVRPYLEPKKQPSSRSLVTCYALHMARLCITWDMLLVFLLADIVVLRFMCDMGHVTCSERLECRIILKF